MKFMWKYGGLLKKFKMYQLDVNHKIAMPIITIIGQIAVVIAVLGF